MKRLLASALATASLAACDGTSMTTPAPAAAPAQTQATAINFTAFTLQLLRTQSDSAQPVPLDAAQFVFPDDDNPQAFAAALPGT